MSGLLPSDLEIPIVTLFKRRHSSPVRGRAAMLAVATILLASACGSSAESVGPTINLHPPSTGAATRQPANAPTSTLVVTPGRTLTPPSASVAASSSASPSVTVTPRVPPSTFSATAPPPGSPGTSSLTWEPCGGAFECATLGVPLDYAKPTGDQIAIALARLPASDPASRIGSMLINPGGPGASGVEYLQSNGESQFSQALRDRFDIVGFDPRGVGESTPIECLDGPGLDRLNALDPTPDNPAEREALIQGAREFDQACQTHSARLLPHMSTTDAARDMDRIREALGEAKLTYFGFSYGTFLGTIYAGLFPTKIRALVLDGAIDPAANFEQRNEAQARGFSRALTAFLDNCKADTSCAFNNGGHPAEAFDALIAKIDANPLPAARLGDTRPVGPGEAFTGVLFALYSRSSWPYLEQALAQAQEGDGSILLIMADAYNQRDQDGTYKNISAANVAVNCSDLAVPTDIAAYDAMVPVLEQLAPRFGAAIAYSGLTCAFWPIHPASDPGVIKATGAPPILVVGSTGDPATPYDWAVNLARELSSGVLLTRVGEGHTAYGVSECINEHVDHYLISLTVPPANTSCPT